MDLPPRRRTRRDGRLSGLVPKLVLGAVAVLLLFGAAGDAANGWIKAETGCRVLAVVDGDTLRMHCPGHGVRKARLRGMDTPELYSPRCPGELRRAIAASFALRWHLLSARAIAIHPEGRDRYDRTLVRLRVDGDNIAARMIGGGWARPYDGGRRAGWC